MVHLGDITKMSGYTIPPVDVVTFGSPCQDLSIAGKRAGMAGERSGLFSEAVRIIREMRYATFGAYPKYAVWENVPGAFSSNKGEDFHAEPPKAYSFDSLASNSMKSSNPHSGCREVEIAKTLDTSPPDPAKNQGGIAILDVLPFDTTQITSPQNGNNPHFGDPCHPLAATAHPPAAVCLNYINPVAEPLIYDARGNGDGITSPTMTGDHNSRVTDYTAITLQGDTVAGALLARDYKGPGRADSLGRVIAQPVGADLYNGTLTGDKAVTLTTATGQGGANTGPSVIEKIIRWIVRRLTPTECERLQGYPDGWTDLGGWVDSRGKAHKAADSPRYKALGNSIALPQWYYVLGGISDRLPDNATLGSLFDGIGGFPYVWAQLHAGRKELCVWASEIEEFPIAVTKKWFPEVEDGKLF